MSKVPYWVAVARKYEGVREIPGPKANPTILQWARNMGGWVREFFTDDATPWCALYLNAVMEEAGLPLSGRPGSADLLRAASFLTYGAVLDTPCVGAILVFKRPGGFHCGLYQGETLKAYRVLGGNTSDCVSSAWIAQDRCVGVRWPDPAVTPGSRLFLLPTGEPLSTNEQ
jgi:uncharacterized protein (TIGR02594 family)